MTSWLDLKIATLTKTLPASTVFEVSDGNNVKTVLVVSEIS